MTQTPASVKLGKALVTTETLLECCEQFYERDGFVKWADVARALGISRQGVLHRITKARTDGTLSESDYERFRSMSSRRATARYREDERRDIQRRTSEVLFTPENYAWLRKECELRQVTIPDIVNGLLNKARTSQ